MNWEWRRDSSATLAQGGFLRWHPHSPFCSVSFFFFFQGCFEKVEEWLDDNKHMLGTIGMVILVVQVRGSMIDCSFLLHFSPPPPLLLSHLFSSPVFLLFALCLRAFVCVCLSGKFKKKNKINKNACIQWPMCHSLVPRKL